MTNSLQVQTFLSMQTEVGRVVQDTSTIRKASIKDALNRALGIASEMFEWPQLLKADESGVRYLSDTTLTTFMSGDPYAVAPFGCGRIKALVPQVTTWGNIEIISSDALYQRVGSQLNIVGKPMLAAITGRTVQFIPIDTQGVCSVLCTSDANDNILTLRFYFRSSAMQPGDATWVDVSGAFSTAAVLPTNDTVAAGYSLEAIGVPVGWAGSIILQDRNNITVGVVAMTEQPDTSVNGTIITLSRPLMRLWPIPDADYAATWIWWRVPLRLTEDSDIPEIPVSAFLVAKASAEIFSQMGKQAPAQLWEGRAATYLKLATGQNTATKRIQAAPYMGNLVDQTGSGPRWSARY